MVTLDGSAGLVGAGDTVFTDTVGFLGDEASDWRERQRVYEHTRIARKSLGYAIYLS